MKCPRISVRVFEVMLMITLALCRSSQPAHAAPSHEWSKHFGSLNNDLGRGVAVDATGNVYITGACSHSADFGGGPLPNAGGTDIYLAKFDADGVHLWSRSFGDQGADQGDAVAVDRAGNVVVVGEFVTKVCFGADTLRTADGGHFFIAKFDADGHILWDKRLGSPSTDDIIAVTLDPSDNIIVTGGVVGTADFGGGPLTAAGNYDVFLAKYSPSGAHLWSRRFGGSLSDLGRAVATDLAGNVFLAGSFSGNVNFGGGVLFGAGGTDIVLAKYDINGSHVWSKRFGGVSNDQALGLAVDAAGGPVITGSFAGTVDFGGGGLTWTGGTADAYLAHLDAAGSHLWSRAFGSGAFAQGMAVAVDRPGNVFMTGQYYNPVNFGGGLLPSAGQSDIVLAMYGAGGAHQWSRGYGDTGADLGLALTAATAGMVYLTGGYNGTVDFGGGGLTSGGQEDILLAKLATGATAGVSLAQYASLRMASPSPNPFRTATAIGFTLPRAGAVEVTIVDAAGRRVRMLRATGDSGPQVVRWDGRDDAGRSLPAGAYFANVRSGEWTATRPVVRLR